MRDILQERRISLPNKNDLFWSKLHIFDAEYKSGIHTKSLQLLLDIRWI